MINIQKFVCNMFGENCYVVNDETNECVIVDCGALYEEERNAIVNYITRNNLIPKHLIVTHAHIDHNFGNDTIYKTFGLKPEISAEDEFLMSKLKKQAMDFCQINYKRFIPPVGLYFKENDVIEFGNHKFTIISTPGHTPGSVFFYCKEEKLAFSGDTLFRFSIGRTDFELGSFEDLNNSLHQKIAKMPWDTTVMTGHGEQTTLREEMFSNPYLR